MPFSFIMSNERQFQILSDSDLARLVKDLRDDETDLYVRLEKISLQLYEAKLEQQIRAHEEATLIEWLDKNDNERANIENKRRKF